MSSHPIRYDSPDSSWWVESVSTHLETLRDQLRLDRLGLRFCEPQVEREYRAWHRQIAVPFIRIGILASLVAWTLGIVVYYLADPPRLLTALPWILLLMYPALIFCLLTVEMPRWRRWMLPSAALANALAGVLLVGINYLPPALPEVAMGTITIVVFFGFTIFRFHLALVVPTVLSYVALNQALLVDAVRRGELGASIAVLYSLVPGLAFLTGLMVCAVLDHFTRQTFQQERLIAAQTAALDHERQRADSLLHSIFPAHIAEQLKTQPGVIAEQFDEATIVFADLVGFTPLAATLPPQTTVSLLSQIFDTFDEVAERHAVEKIKTIGDAYMAAAGVPVTQARHAETAVHFALDLRDALSELSARVGMPLEVRIGLHTGTVVGGVIGRQKLAYDLWGDTVNTASRMESHAAGGMIQITQTTYDLVKDTFVCEPRGTIAVKGKGEMPVWQVVRRAA